MKKYLILLLMAMAFSIGHAVEHQRIKVIIRDMVVLDTIVETNNDVVILDLTNTNVSTSAIGQTNAPKPSNLTSVPAATSSSSYSSSSTQTTVTRCAATTKKGTRCKRNAAPGSRYCWQHK